MAITAPTVILNAFDDTNLGLYDTAAATLTAGRWYTMTTHMYSSAPADTNLSVIHNPLGTSLSFALVGRVQKWDVQDARTLEVWAVRPAATTEGALIRIDPSATQSTMGWILAEWSAGVDPTTFAVQVATNNGIANTSATVTMAAYSAADNATFFIAADGTGTGGRDALSADEGRTELAENTPTEVRSSCANYYEIPHGGDVTLSATIASAEDWGTIGIEVKAAVVAGGAVEEGYDKSIGRGIGWGLG